MAMKPNSEREEENNNLTHSRILKRFFDAQVAWEFRVEAVHGAGGRCTALILRITE